MVLYHQLMGFRRVDITISYLCSGCSVTTSTHDLVVIMLHSVEPVQFISKHKTSHEPSFTSIVSFSVRTNTNITSCVACLIEIETKAAFFFGVFFPHWWFFTVQKWGPLIILPGLSDFTWSVVSWGNSKVRTARASTRYLCPRTCASTRIFWLLG